jgi:rod shape-determining protein MreD
MTRYVTGRLVAVAVVALVLELTALDALSWGGGRPELVLAMACFAALFARDAVQSAVACWTLGLMKDLGSAGHLGWHALVYLLVGAFLVRVRLVIFRDHVVTQLTVGAGAAAAVALATAVFVSLTQGVLPPGVWAGRIVATTLLTALAAPMVMTALAEARFLRS